MKEKQSPKRGKYFVPMFTSIPPTEENVEMLLGPVHKEPIHMDDSVHEKSTNKTNDPFTRVGIGQIQDGLKSDCPTCGAEPHPQWEPMEPDALCFDCRGINYNFYPQPPIPLDYFQ